MVSETVFEGTIHYGQRIMEIHASHVNRKPPPFR
jgi:hypothetical protein